MSISIQTRNAKSHNSAIVDELAKRLKEEGYNVMTNIGSSGFKIDLGITNPKYTIRICIRSSSVMDIIIENQKQPKTGKLYKLKYLGY